MVIGGQAVLAYCGVRRTTKDTDLVASTDVLGPLMGALKHCGFSVEETEFGLAAARRTSEGGEVLHLSIGQIIDASRGPRESLSYRPSTEAFSLAPVLALVGVAEPDTKEVPKAPVLPLEDLLVTKLLPIHRDVDMDDATMLILLARPELDVQKVAQRIIAQEELVPIIFDRISELASYLRARRFGTLWAGGTWTVRDWERVRVFLGQLEVQLNDALG